jgi:hypothetical protein
MEETMRITKTRAAVLSLAASAATLAPAALTAASAGAVGSVPPTITAHPDNVMVNTTTKLVGRGFAKGATLHIAECASTTWVVPASPCDTANAITVTTNRMGKFTATFTVQACPTSTAADTPGLSARCYIGVPSPSGIDTVSLQPYTAIVVTYP